MDFSEADQILDKVEQALVKVIGIYGLRRPNIERWRWDEPGITLTWSSASDAMGRTIHAVIDEEHQVIKAEANAWQDEDQDGGRRRLRHWTNAHIATVSILASPDDIFRVAVEPAYKQASSWHSKQLDKNTLVQTSLGS